MMYSTEDLKQKCLEYDKSTCEYPESQWEGKALYDFITGAEQDFSITACDEWEICLEGMK